MRKWVSQPLTDLQWVQNPLKHRHLHHTRGSASHEPVYVQNHESLCLQFLNQNLDINLIMIYTQNTGYHD